MRYLPTILLFLPVLLAAQELHPFRNGEVADAEKINENFDLLMQSIVAEEHPTGALAFRSSDRTIVINSNVPGQQAWSNNIEVDIPEGNGTWRVIEGSAVQRVSHQGIAFNRVYFNRIYSGSTGVVENNFCPDDTEFWIPVEIYWAYSNDLGAMLIGTDWQFSDNTAHPDKVGPSNQNGSYLCFDGSAFTVNYNLAVFASFGRYACASWSGGRFISGDQGGLTVTGGNASLPIPSLPGQASFSINVGHEILESTGAATSSILSVDIPEACDSESRFKSPGYTGSALLRMIGVNADLLPTQ